MYQFLLITHIMLGGIALISGALAGMARKQKGLHTQMGYIFVISMLSSSLAAIVLTFYKFNPFLQVIGFFTLYMVLMGYGAFKHHYYKKFLPILGILFGIFLISSGFLFTQNFNVVAVVFGVVQLSMAVVDLSGKIKNVVVLHASRIGGAYIASVTAFSVTTLTFLPWYLGWFAPSIIGAVLISRSLNKFRKPVS